MNMIKYRKVSCDVLAAISLYCPTSFHPIKITALDPNILLHFNNPSTPGTSTLMHIN